MCMCSMCKLRDVTTSSVARDTTPDSRVYFEFREEQLCVVLASNGMCIIHATKRKMGKVAEWNLEEDSCS